LLYTLPQPGTVLGLEAPDQPRLLVASAEGGARLYELATGALVDVIGGQVPGGVTAVGFSPDGARAAAGAPPARRSVWDVAGRRMLATFATAARPQLIAFSPSGNALAVAGAEDPALFVWTAPLGVISLVGHRSRIHWLRFDREGRRVLSTGRDGT